MNFTTEQDLFNTALESSAIQHLASLYTNTFCAAELGGLFGVPDLVIASHLKSETGDTSIIAFAFEMKLSDWKRALAQAFRYRAFAEMSFVILDGKFVGRALKQLDKFQTANVGLLSTDVDGSLRIHHQPRTDLPFCRQTRAAFERIVLDNIGLQASIGFLAALTTFRSKHYSAT
jgi:hypothetical protein